MKKQIKDLLQSGNFGLNGRVWIENEGNRFFGPGPMELLEGIERTGSISKAAKSMGMSYKKAWEIVHRLNSLSARPFVVTNIGGEDGGGSSITPDAREMITWYQELKTRFRLFLEKESMPFKS